MGTAACFSGVLFWSALLRFAEAMLVARSMVVFVEQTVMAVLPDSDPSCNRLSALSGTCGSDVCSRFESAQERPAPVSVRLSARPQARFRRVIQRSLYV